MILDPTPSIRIQVGPLAFTASWEEGAAPRTCAAFRRLLPYRQRIIQARWSGEAGWILEDNEAMNRGLEAMGGEIVKRYRVYERGLGGS